MQFDFNDSVVPFSVTTIVAPSGTMAQVVGGLPVRSPALPSSVYLGHRILGQDTSPALPDGGACVYGSLNSVSLAQGSCGYNVRSSPPRVYCVCV